MERKHYVLVSLDGDPDIPLRIGRNVVGRKDLKAKDKRISRQQVEVNVAESGVVTVRYQLRSLWLHNLSHIGTNPIFIQRKNEKEFEELSKWQLYPLREEDILTLLVYGHRFRLVKKEHSESTSKHEEPDAEPSQLEGSSEEEHTKPICVFENCKRVDFLHLQNYRHPKRSREEQLESDENPKKRKKKQPETEDTTRTNEQYDHLNNVQVSELPTLTERPLEALEAERCEIPEPEEVPQCTHAMPATVRHVVKEGPTQGRKFYTCPLPKDAPLCKKHQTYTSLNYVKKEGPNKGRLFWSCGIKDCPTFIWDKQKHQRPTAAEAIEAFKKRKSEVVLAFERFEEIRDLFG